MEPSHFSKHALKRIRQRTKLSLFDIADILDYRKTVNIGSIIVFDKNHYLFYSKLDNSYFVIIQNNTTGKVITILPLEYHENSTLTINYKDLIEARKVSTLCVENNLKTNFVASTAPPLVITIKAHYMSDQGWQKTATLGKLKALDYDNNLAKVLDEDTFNSKVDQLCKIKGVDVKKVFTISVSLGSRGSMLEIEWNS
jgi:hypothetical protein